MTPTQINAHLLKLVVNERKITNEILQNIAEFYKCKGYVKMGYASIIQYLTKGLGYSDDQAYRRWAGAKLLIQIPEAAAKIAAGHLNLSQAACAQKAFETAAKEQPQSLSKEKQQEILESLAQKNNFETQKILCEQLNLKPQKEERIRPQSDQTVRFEVVLTKEQYEKFEQVKSLLSHQIPDQKNAGVLEAVCTFYIKHKLGQKKQEQKPESKQEPKQEQETPQGFMVSKKDSSRAASRYIPSEFKRIVFSRAGGKCEYVHSETGLRCNSTYQLEYDHIQPMGFGGKTELSNLRLCCRSCNAYAAWTMGIGFETTSYFSMREHRKEH